MGKSNRKSSKCNSSAASCGIGTVDGGARGLRADHAVSSRLNRALSRLDLPCLSCLSVPCDSLRFTAVYCVCYSASTHNNKRGKLLMARVTERLAEGSSPSWLGLPLGAARAHDVVYGDVVVLRSPAAAGESLETTRVPVCERRLLNQIGSRRSATHPPHHAG